MLLLFTTLAAFCGLFIGSFLNVVALRVHAGKQFVKGRSECPSCHHELGALELLPVVSWIGLRGKCRHCGKAISKQYPLVEAASGVLFGLSYYLLQPQGFSEGIQFGLWLIVLAGFIVLSVYDLRWMLLPDKIVFPLVVPAFLMAVVGAYASSAWQPLLGPIQAATLFGGAFYALATVADGKWMGGGDVKLVFVIGILLGLKHTALALLLAFWSAAIIGLVLMALRRKSRRDQLPFGPYLMVGATASYLVGDPILSWYFGLAGVN